MKKIFTLIAGVFCAMCANAQGVYAVAEGDVITAGDQITSVEGVTMTYSAGGGTFVAGKKTKNWADSLTFVAYTNGSVNGKFVKDGEPTGCYYKFETAKDGHLVVGVQLNADKGFFIVNGAFEKVTDYAYYLPESADATESQAFTDNEKGEQIIAKKSNGTVSFNVAKGGTYYVFAGGTKMGFFGFKFEEGSIPSSISGVAAEKASIEAPAFNLAGQKVGNEYKGLVVKNGKKVVRK